MNNIDSNKECKDKKKKVNNEFYPAQLFNDHFQNYKSYGIPKAQLIIADIPYNISKDAYASRPEWFHNRDLNNGRSELANKPFFNSDGGFRISEFLHFCTKMLRPEPKEVGVAPCMLVFCEFEQQFELIEKARDYGLKKYINLVFRKNYSAQVLKANMRVVGNCEYGVLLYRNKLPKFNNGGKMVMNCMDYPKDTTTPRVHPNQKPISLLSRLIEIFTDPGEVVIDPCAGSGSTLRAAEIMGRRSYGFEIDKGFFKRAKEEILSLPIEER